MRKSFSKACKACFFSQLYRTIYNIIGTVNLFVICWPVRIMTINGTNSLNIYQIVFFLFNTMTMKLTSRDLWICFLAEFILCSFEDISLDKVISAIEMTYKNPACFLTCFPTMDNGYDYPNDLCVQNTLWRRLDPIEILQIRLD